MLTQRRKSWLEDLVSASIAGLVFFYLYIRGDAPGYLIPIMFSVILAISRLLRRVRRR